MSDKSQHTQALIAHTILRELILGMISYEVSSCSPLEHHQHIATRGYYLLPSDASLRYITLPNDQLEAHALSSVATPCSMPAASFSAAFVL